MPGFSPNRCFSTFRSGPLLAALLLCIGFAAHVSPASAAALVNPFGREAQALDPEDWELLKKTLRTTLDLYEVDKVVKWESASGERAGEARIIETFEKKGLRCANLEHKYTKGGGAKYVIPFCQVADGTWKIAF